MPIISTVDRERRMVESLAVGPVTYAHIESHLMRLKGWNALAYDEFMDVRGSGALFMPGEVEQIAGLFRKLSEGSRRGRNAVLVSSDFAESVVRQLAMLIEDVGEIQPFLDERKARGWLAAKGAGGSST